MGVVAPGDTCWRTAKADRAAFLIDTEAYFNAAYEVMKRARRSVLLLGWGFDPRTRLFPDGSEGTEAPDRVGRLLLDLAEARPEIDIRLLIWKSALPVSASQEFFPHKARRWFENTRVHFRLDDMVPFGACHHQKVLVVDDQVAFCGGGDICVDRWDSAGHLDADRRRLMPSSDCHDPRHEVMMMVEGDIAAALGDLARERWDIATGEKLTPPPKPETSPWPRNVPAHLSNVEIGIARTAPAWHGRTATTEIRRLNLASIFSARTSIYLENQYFTSPLICEALASRLAEPDGPEVVLVSTGHSPSWFDRMTMDRARSNMLWRLRSADIFGRFRAYHPITRLGGGIVVHAKTCVIDDRLARVGSANLNNRSGGFDTECELAVEAREDDAASRLAISAFRDRSIGHFMGQTGDAVAKARQERGGLIAAIEDLNRDGRLKRIEPMKLGAFGEFVATWHVGDPESVQDSWRLERRRERLYAEARALGRGGPFMSRDWAAPFMPVRAGEPGNPSPAAGDPTRAA